MLHEDMVLQVVLPEVPLAAGLTLEGSVVQLHCSLCGWPPLSSTDCSHCPVSGLVPHRWDELQPPIPALTHTALSHFTAFILQNAVMAVLGLKLAMFIINH